MIAKEPPKQTRLLLKNVDKPGYTTDIECYEKHGGYEMLKKAVTMDKDKIIEEVKIAGVRGRGGAGFPAGVKWGFINHKTNTKPVYLICNADESEPGTFKDKQIIYKDPHQLLEGILITCWANRIRSCYIYIRGEFPEGAKILDKAIEEARAKGYVGKNILGTDYSTDIVVHRGAGSYICGEETGLIESLEGKRPYPRIKPPYFPAVMGLYMCPTIVNNVETLSNISHILRLGGGAEYAKMGYPGNTGTRIIACSGDVQNPGYFEFVCGSLTMGEFLYDVCGGPRPGRKFQAVIPGGSSTKVLDPQKSYTVNRKQEDGSTKQIEVHFNDIKVDFDSLVEVGSSSGTGGAIVMDDSRDLVACLNNLNTFYAHESCGQCTPCREGSLWLKKITDRLLAGKGREADADLLKNVADNVAGKTICAHGEAVAWPVQSFTTVFRDRFVDMGKKGKGPEDPLREPAPARTGSGSGTRSFPVSGKAPTADRD